MTMRKDFEGQKRYYLRSVFRVVEYIIKTTLLDTSRNLIMYYIESSGEVGMSNKARFAISRYTNEELPSLDEIRQRSGVSGLNDLDHLLLKMEYASKRLEEGR